MTVGHIITLLEFSLKNIYLFFQVKVFEQIEGAAMGSPISPIVANLYIKGFEIRAINTNMNPKRIWRRFVDDTFVVERTSDSERFFEHINSIDPLIQFIVEETRPHDSRPFLDTLTLCLCQSHTEPLPLQLTESPLTQTYTYNGTATTTLLQNTV